MAGRYVHKITTDNLEECYARFEELFRVNSRYDPLPSKVVVKYMFHFTTLSGKRGIEQAQRVYGEPTDMPARSPLGGNPRVKGVWLMPADTFLPEKSPFGNKRIMLDPLDIVRHQAEYTYDDETLKENSGENAEPTAVQTTGHVPASPVGVPTSTVSVQTSPLGILTSPDDVQASEISVQTLSVDVQKLSVSGRGHKTKKGKKSPKKADSVEDKSKKEFYLKDARKEKIPTAPALHPSKRPPKELPLLFFECAHHFGEYQYVRLILINSRDPHVYWCRRTCKLLDIRDNLFLEYSSDLLWMRRHTECMRYDVTLEVLLAGDLVLGRMSEPPRWMNVGSRERVFHSALGVAH